MTRFIRNTSDCERHLPRLRRGSHRDFTWSTREGQGRTEAGRALVHFNDVAGFIGPEIFRTREQLVRCCLEDLVLGTLHGSMVGLDVCSTRHMDVSLDDLDWCLDRIMPANSGYLMGLPTKNDPMLSYLTTAYQTTSGSATSTATR